MCMPMIEHMEQSFAALSSREKMQFLRWAAESVGAKLETVFGAAEFSKTAFEDNPVVNDSLTMSTSDWDKKHSDPYGEADIPVAIVTALPSTPPQPGVNNGVWKRVETSIPEFLKRKK